MGASKISDPNSDPIGAVEQFLITAGGVWAAAFDTLKLAMLNPHSEDEQLTEDVKGANSRARELLYEQAVRALAIDCLARRHGGEAVGEAGRKGMKLYVVEWIPVDGSYVVGIFTSEARARSVFDAFDDPEDRDGWVYLNEYETDVVYPLETPKQIAERRIE